MVNSTSPSARSRAARTILSLIRESPEITRAELGVLSGLSSSTIGHVVTQLLEDGAVTEAVLEKGIGSGSGRPSRALSAVSAGLPIGAIDFGHGHIRVAVGDDSGQLQDESFVGFDVDVMAQDSLDLACDQLRHLVSKNNLGPLAAIVAGIPGPLDGTTGRVCSPTILSGWWDLAPAWELERRLGVPVHIENDAVLGAMGELRRDGNRPPRDFMYVKSAHGVGAALVLNGEVYRGHGGLAGEIGHTHMPGHSELCRCGSHGCLEAVVTLSSVLEEVAFTHPPMKPEQVQLATMTDVVTNRILEDRGRTLGIALARMCNLLNPEALVLGGELGSSGPAFVSGVQESIERFTLPAIADTLNVRKATHGIRSELLGALHLAAQLAQQQLTTADGRHGR